MPLQFPIRRPLALKTKVLGGALLLTLGALGVVGALGVAAVQPRDAAQTPAPLVTGKRLTPRGNQTAVGSFPANMVLSPDGKYVLVTDIGLRSQLSVLSAKTGEMVSHLDWNGPSPVFRGKKRALYYGLVCGPAQGGQTPVYVSRGAEGTVSVLNLSAAGELTDTKRVLGVQNQVAAASGASAPAPAAPATRSHFAGLGLSADGRQLFAADNSADPQKGMRGAVQVLDTRTGALQRQISVAGYPYALASGRDGAVYVSSEQRGTVSVLDGDTGQTRREIEVGTQPIALLLDRGQGQLFVANAGSDTVSIIDTARGRVALTVVLRPDGARGLPGATPTGLALSPDEKRLFVTLADMNAVAVIDLPRGTLAGYVPVGWHPTSALVSPDGTRLFVANAKGVRVRNPNAKPDPSLKERPQYIQNLLEGTVSTLDLTAIRDLEPLTDQVMANNRAAPTRQARFKNPGIKHVFYIIKENRTYDQVLGDLGRGDGDPSLALYGREVTPNQHALALRFALLDNFYCCAEVSGDGWNWSTGGMASEFTSRNVPHSYGGRQRAYDFEGTNNGIAVDRLGIPDAARPPGGYLWDLAARGGVSFRNYGFFTDDFKAPRQLAEEGTEGAQNEPTKRALVGKSDANFRQYDITYADSEAWQLLKIPPAPRQRSTYGAMQDPSRVTAWKREFAEFERNGKLPALSMLRLPRDHTAGTTVGASTPAAMVADNDFAVGQVVETVSKSKYWKSSAIVIVEDDAQNGYDHIDAHRSIAFVISPFVGRGRHDNRFYNTDSALKTIELLLGLPPMTQYDAIAPPIAVFGAQPLNAEPFEAITPARAIISGVNTRATPDAVASARFLNPLREESGPDEMLNAILWHAAKGKQAPPARRYGIRFSADEEEKD